MANLTKLFIFAKNLFSLLIVNCKLCVCVSTKTFTMNVHIIDYLALSNKLIQLKDDKIKNFNLRKKTPFLISK